MADGTKSEHTREAGLGPGERRMETVTVGSRGGLEEEGYHLDGR